MGDNCQVNSTVYTFSIGGISNGITGCGTPPVQPVVVGNQSMGSAAVCVSSPISLVCSSNLVLLALCPET